jgi:hypothetical protein
MITSFITSSAKRKSSVWAMAFLLLLTTGADLAFPQCCSEEAAAGTAATESYAFIVSDDVGSGAGNQSHQDAASGTSEKERDSDSTSCKDDCFCCMRVTPGAGFAGIIVLPSKSPTVITGDDNLPSPPLRSTYHPPRQA